MKYLRDMDDLAFTLNANARKKGFWDADTEDNRVIFYLKQLAMVHSEVSETLEAIRKEMGDDVVVEELADIIIRVLDLWAGMSTDQYTNHSLAKAVNEKMEKNSSRPKMHGVLA
jgi:NTP pyrophosphatase (non-canonical NTP hydrolase)